MFLKLVAKCSDPPLGALILSEIVSSEKNIKIPITWTDDWKGSGNAQLFDKEGRLVGETNNDVARYLARTLDTNLYGGDEPSERTEVDHWLSFSIGPLQGKQSVTDSIEYLDRMLMPRTWLVAKHLTIADICVFSSLFEEKDLVLDGKYPHVNRWFKQILSLSATKSALDSVSKNGKASKNVKKLPKKAAEKEVKATQNVRKQEGKFIELPGAEMGKVVVRFPPEASGYLHIGHAKAALLNQYYAEAFKGQLIMRFDDTNPAKENVEFEKAILEDLEMLEIKPDRFTHSSDYFDLMLKYCAQLIKDGKAFVDDTPAQEMKDQRDQRLPSSNRNNSVEKNMKMWEEMQKGTPKGLECCVRAKIDHESANGCLRDPTIYRCKPEPHPRTGTKYKVYPTYDFACPIVDAVEGVTHTLRTTEYHDRDAQFYWFIEALNLNRPYIWEYSRLNMTNTVLSKRKLTWFVAEGLVDGWDDPRFPTVRGILRRGMTVDGLKQFIIAQGSSRSVVFMEWDKIWAFNKKVIDPIAVRYTALEFDKLVPLKVEGVKDSFTNVSNHPKDPSLGTKRVEHRSDILIEKVDADALKEGENATFVHWGNIMIKKIKKEKAGVVGVEAALNLENKDFKNTLKLTWLPVLEPDEKNTEAGKLVPCYAVYYDHIISKPVLGKDEDFKDFINKTTRTEVKMLGEPTMKNIKKGEIIQIQRKGFFRCDVPYQPPNTFSSQEQPLILFHIPDGHAIPSNNQAASNSTEKNTQPTKQKNDRAIADLNEKIVNQGNKVRDLKAAKADKATIGAEVKVLLDLKTEFKTLTGAEWKPGAPIKSVESKTSDKNNDSVIADLNEKIVNQGNKVRDLKAAKADKAAISAEVKILLDLKTEFKTLTGAEWKPGAPIKSVESKTSDKNNDSLIAELNEKIVNQGNKVRDLKAAKVDKATIGSEVKVLLDLKTEFKTLTGAEWKPGVSIKSVESKTSNMSVNDLFAQIQQQENKIDEEAKKLSLLKAEYKKVTGQDWKSGISLNNSAVASNDINNSASSLSIDIAKQGDKVRELKSQKADKAKIDEEVKELLRLKTEYKNATGQVWQPNNSQTLSKNSQVPDVSSSNESKVDEIQSKITQQGEKVRQLKADKAEKNIIDEQVKTLLSLKDEYKLVTGQKWTPPSAVSDKKDKKDKKAETKGKDSKVVKVQAQKKDDKTKEDTKTGTRLGLEAKKSENLPEWYSQVITKSEMIEYYNVSGCYVLRPWSFSIWESIKDYIDKEIKKLGVENCYFPIFVSQAALEREKTHIADFAPEVAWVTKSGTSDLAEPIAIRPTSETVMYPAYAKWLSSYRDLPLRLNQWNNVVRWEFKHPQPFLRTREFLWQEGHTAFATKAEADEEVMTILSIYTSVYEDLLAIPVVRGRKTEKEKFAGGDYTTTVEAFISASGRAIQGATSHHLGQNFSKMFDIQVEGAEEGGEKTLVYQNSWGLTTRTIGVMVMVHADDKGLVLPPRVACIQAVIVPCGITASTTPEQRQNLLSECEKLEQELKKSGNLRIKGDYRDNYSPGWKFNHWELKGVPLRIELGPKDLEKKQVTLVRRDTAERLTKSRSDIYSSLSNLLEEIHFSLFNKAKDELSSHVKQAHEWSNFCSNLDNKNLILAPFCGEISCEDNIKTDSVREDASDEPGAPSMGAKSLCIPFDQPKDNLSILKCIHKSCQNKPKYYTLFGRSY